MHMTAVFMENVAKYRALFPFLLILSLAGCGEVESRSFETTELSMVYKSAGEPLSNQVAFFYRDDLDRDWITSITGDFQSPSLRVALSFNFDDAAIEQSGGARFRIGQAGTIRQEDGSSADCGSGLTFARVEPPDPENFDLVEIDYDDECLEVNVSFRAY